MLMMLLDGAVSFSMDAILNVCIQAILLPDLPGSHCVGCKNTKDVHL
jgi:hypothetical protein